MTMKDACKERFEAIEAQLKPVEKKPEEKPEFVEVKKTKKRG
jgi:hypothetical protein